MCCVDIFRFIYYYNFISLYMRRQQYNELLKRIPSPTSIPEFNTEGRLIICLVEFRIMDEIEQVINAVLRV